MTGVKRASASYLLPIRSQRAEAAAELAEYLRSLHGVEIIVVDGSDPEIFACHAALFPSSVRHLPPDSDIAGANGKVRGVLTGLRRVSHDRVVVADDDVRYTPWTLRAAIAALDEADVVRPQNFFDPAPWHAVLDTSRTLINRVTGGDWPGTLAFRRSFLPRGYDADTLFENLELVRTVLARGGRERVRYDLFVRRLPPTAAHYLDQRVRQAYDEFARPARMAAALAIVPLTLAALARGRVDLIIAGIGAAQLLAAGGWLRSRAYRFFSFLGVLAAPLWVAERGVCAWLALYQRVRYGGVRYAGGIVRRAASCPKELSRPWAV
jgi:hypothetical protein